MSWLVMRYTIMAILVTIVIVTQQYWFRAAWRAIGRIRLSAVRWALRGAWALALAWVLLSIGHWMFGSREVSWRTRMFGEFAVVGLWLGSAFAAYAGVKFVRVVEWFWERRARKARRGKAAEAVGGGVNPPMQDPGRRTFFKAATFAAAAAPFSATLYGYLGERLHYRVEHVEVPIAGLPEALVGLRIVQLSDIHFGAFMPQMQVRRAVALANEQGADLTVVTGDYVTVVRDPIEECVEELAALRAPLGVWGCLGNHEIYADIEQYATELFGRAGVRILRQESAEIVRGGATLNLAGVDYQRTRDVDGNRLPMLPDAGRLVRPGVPNVLLSHNPIAFQKAAELGFDLTISGHTHGGQISVEILHENLSPARMFTNYVAGAFWRPSGAIEGAADPEGNTDLEAAAKNGRASVLYVNRGLGTIGIPVRFGAPPEITVLVLRRV